MGQLGASAAVEVADDRADRVAVGDHDDVSAGTKVGADALVPVAQDTPAQLVDAFGAGQQAARYVPVPAVVHGVARVVWVQLRWRRCRVRAPGLPGGVAPTTDDLLAGETLEEPEVTFVQAPVPADRGFRMAPTLQQKVGALLGSAEQAGVDDLDRRSVDVELLSGAADLCAASRA